MHDCVWCVSSADHQIVQTSLMPLVAAHVCASGQSRHHALDAVGDLVQEVLNRPPPLPPGYGVADGDGGLILAY